MSLKLYDYWRSSACYRVRIALNLKGLDYELEQVHLVNDGGQQKSVAYKKLNPQQLVPTLVDGDIPLSQSLAIIEYLDETHPNPPLIWGDAVTRAHIRKMAMAVAMDVHPLNNLRVLQYIQEEFGASDEQKNTWYAHWVIKGFEAMEAWVDEAEDFCAGDKPSMADVCLIPQLYNAHRFNVPLDSYPNLLRVEKNCLALDAFMRAVPKEA